MRTWQEFGGAAAQLGVNLVALLLGGLARLYVQRRIHAIRRRRHLLDESREVAGLLVGMSNAHVSD
jgi:hypothetical protein